MTTPETPQAPIKSASIQSSSGACYKAYFASPPTSFRDMLHDAVLNETNATEDEDEENDPYIFSSPLTTPPDSPPPTRSPSPVPSTAASGDGPAQSKSRKTKRNKAKSKELRKRKRLEESTTLDPKKGRPAVAQNYVVNAQALDDHLLESSKLRVAQGAYVGIRDGNADQNKRTVEELVDAEGPYRMFYHAWDGKQTYLILDNKTGRVMCVLACPPDDPTWKDTHAAASDYLKENGPKCSYPTRKDKDTGEIKIPRRGDFGALSCGISHGGGQTEPKNLKYKTKKNAKVLEGMKDHWAFKRIAGHGSSLMLTWAPKMHHMYSEMMRKLLAFNTKLKRPFPNSVFANFTANFGPETVCYDHKDSGNLPCGWCVITALGEFDYKRGGHLVLWDLNMVIEFPPGCSIMIPSAIMRHSNTCIRPGELRYSFTQYSAGGLFRFVDYNFQLDEDYWGGLKGEALKEALKHRSSRRREAFTVFSSVDELLSSV